MVATRPDEADRPLTEVQERAAEVEDVLVVPDTEPHPDDGVEHDERIELVRTGLVRIWIGGKRYRLRRPFFGQFRDLRLALQDVNDEVAEAADESLMVARQMTAEEKDADGFDPEEWASWRRDQRKRSTATRNRMTETAETARLGWWVATWEALTLDGSPPEWPPWVVDPGLHSALVAHWRTSPLGRG